MILIFVHILSTIFKYQISLEIYLATSAAIVHFTTNNTLEIIARQQSLCILNPGELAEVALAQATEKIDIGAAGGWNSTLNPKYYFLQKSQLLQLTDAEIRGAVDGLYMASKMAEWKGKFNDLKISQLLDIYYSPYQKGLFAPDFTSCNRNKLYTSVTSNEVMQKEVLCVMKPLDDVAQFGQTVDEQMYGSLGDAALDSFNNYFRECCHHIL